MAKSIFLIENNHPAHLQANDLVSVYRVSGSEIEGHYKGLHVEILLLKGGCTVIRDNLFYNISAPSFVDLMPFGDIVIDGVSDDLYAMIVVTSMKTRSLMYRQAGRMPWQYVMRLRSYPVLKVTAAQADCLKDRITLMEEVIGQIDAFAYIGRVISSYTLFESEISNIYIKDISREDIKPDIAGSPFLYESFAARVLSDVRLHHDVKYYANEIGVSVQHLSRVIKSVLGISPKNYIDYILTGEIQMMVVNTTLTFKEIALACGFEDPNSMLRFLRRNLGVSARFLRESLNCGM